jgi:hypothetical protein
MKVGDKVHYCSIIGRHVTSLDHVIKSISLKPNDFNEDVAWLTNKSGAVAMLALVKAEIPYRDVERREYFRKMMKLSKQTVYEFTIEELELVYKARGFSDPREVI